MCLSLAPPLVEEWRHMLTTDEGIKLLYPVFEKLDTSFDVFDDSPAHLNT